MSEFEPQPDQTQRGAADSAAAVHPVAPPAAGPAALHGAPPFYPPPKKSRAGIFFLGAFSGCALLFFAFLFLGILVAAVADDTSDVTFAAEKIAVIPVEGEIIDAREILDALHRHAGNDSVKAIVIRINSPGGAIVPSQEIYAEIRKTRQESGKPIVASLNDVAASGGYYIAAACDEIIANPGSITGSIGVILQWLEYKELLKWAKMRPETITSGMLKAAGSPYEQLTEAERAYLQRIVMQLHGQFVKAVAEGRKGKLTVAEVSTLADGRVFTGEEAVTLKLVDRLGNLDDALQSAAKRAGVKGKFGTIYPKRREPRLIDVLSGSDAEAALERVLSRRTPRFLYKW